MLQRPSSKQQRRWQQLLQQFDSQPQLCSQPQLFSQPQLCSQPQLFSQPQEASQQPQLWHENMPRTRSHRPLKQQRRWQQLLQQEFSQPQLCSQPQLFSQPQLCSQAQLFSQPQPQLLPPHRPKKAFALPAEPSTRATASVAKAKHRFIGGLLKMGREKQARQLRRRRGKGSEMEGATPVPPTSDH
jgi:hypothetical protein